MATAVIVDAVRTAGGKRNGKLSGWHPADLAAETLKALVERNDLDPGAHRRRDHGLRHAGRRPGRSTSAATPCWPPGSPSRCPPPPSTASAARRSSRPTSPPRASSPAPTTSSSRPASRSCRPRRWARRSPPGSFPFGPGVIGALRRARAAWCPRASRPRSSPTSGTSPARTSTPSAPAASSGRAQARDEGRFDNEIIPVAGQAPRQGDRRAHRHRRDRHRRRGHPPRHHGRDAGQPQAGLQARRQGHRRQLVADHRRRLGRADHERGEGQRARPHARGPASTPSPSPASTRSRC